MSTIETIALAAGVAAAVEIGGLMLLWVSYSLKERREQPASEASELAAKQVSVADVDCIDARLSCARKSLTSEKAHAAVPVHRS